MRLLLEKWEAYLEEGKADDIVAKYPNLKPAFDAGIKNPQQLTWMAKRLGDTPIEDAIDAVKEFDKSKSALKAKKKNTDIYGYKTVQDLKDIVQSIGPSGSEKDAQLEKERILVGEFGDWKVELPLTTASACQIGKGTVWCTAATKVKNMFLHYTEQGYILFHITKRGADPRKDPTAKLNVGFKDGEAVLDGNTGGLSVDAKNIGLNTNKLQKILGDQFEPIMQAMQAQSDELGGIHPAKGEKEERERKQREEILNGAERAAKDPGLNKEFYERIKGQMPDLRITYLEKLFASEPIPEVVDFYVEEALNGPDDNAGIRVLSTRARPAAIDRIFVKSKEMGKEISATFAILLSRSPYIHAEALVRLTEIPAFINHDDSSSVRMSVLGNDKLPLKVALKYLDKYIEERKSLSSQDRDRESFLKRVEADNVIEDMASRKDLPPEMLKKLAKTSDSAKVLSDVGMNVNTPPDVLLDLATERIFMIKMAVAKNPSSPANVLTALLKSIKKDVLDGTGRGKRRAEQLTSAVQNNPNYTIAGRVKAGASDLLRRLVKEELEAVLREKGIKN